MEAPLFSVVVIARNEAQTLPRLIKSLAEFQKRGGKIVVLDTGSTDGTPDIARGLGCLVQVNTTFKKVISEEEAKAINARFVFCDEDPLVKAGQTYFDFASARNYAASLAQTDFVFMPDCDEIWTAFDIDKINQAIRDGAKRLEYDFVFSHDEQHRPLIQFKHSKAYDRQVFKWVGVVHEVLSGDGKTVFMPASLVKLEHFQNPSQDRGQYLTGLAVDCFQNPKADRNSHYLARELMWNKRPRSAIKEFERHIAMNAWAPERAQSKIFIGDCHAFFGETEEELACYMQAINIDSSRREPLMKLAAHYFRKNDAQRVAVFATAALSIAYRGYYMDRMSYYREDPHKLLYWAFYYLNQKDAGRAHWELARSYCPDDPRLLADAQFFLELPRVTILVPTLGREASLQRTLNLIKENANYPAYDVDVYQDSFENRRGVIKMVNDGVDQASNEVVMFLTNDCEPQPNFLIQAVLAYLANPGCLVALNDGLWNGALATHWLAPKALRKELDGNFFSPLFKHHGCDNLLTAQCKALGKYTYAPLARVKHTHTQDEVSDLAWASQAEDKAVLKERLEQLGLEDPV